MFIDTKETAFLEDLSKPSLRALSQVLRNRELWPDGFSWYFNSCAHCAMGLASKLWSEINLQVHDTDGMARMLGHRIGLTSEEAYSIFLGARVSSSRWGNIQFMLSAYEVPVDQITPEMVADEIDKVLASR